MRGGDSASPRGAGCFSVAGHGFRITERCFCREVAAIDEDAVVGRLVASCRLHVRHRYFDLPQNVHDLLTRSFFPRGIDGSFQFVSLPLVQTLPCTPNASCVYSPSYEKNQVTQSSAARHHLYAATNPKSDDKEITFR